MKVYNERTMKDFLWITVLYSSKVNLWSRSLNLSTTRTAGNKWCRQCWGLRILWNKSSAFWSKSETLRLSDIYPDLFKRLNIASTLPISSAGGGDNWTTGAINRAKLQSNHHHQHPFFSGRMPFLSPNQQCQSTEGNITFHGLAYPKLIWGLPTLSLTTNSSWLPWGRLAMPLISPPMSVPQLLILFLICINYLYIYYPWLLTYKP